MKINKEFVSYFARINQDQTYSKNLFEHQSTFKKKLKKILDAWAVLFIVALMFLCVKIAAEGFLPFLIQWRNH